MNGYKTFTLLPHQKRVVEQNKPKILCDHEPRCGKTLIACHWVDNPAQAGNTYIICKKSNKKSWIDMGTQATVLTKEEFKKAVIKKPTAIVVDEVHNFGASLFVKGRSELATTLYTLLKDNPNCHFMGLSGTMVRNSPWSLHTLLCYVGIYLDWKKWRDAFFSLEYKPYMTRPAYFPKDNWREGVYKVRKKYCDQVSLRDVVDTLPPIHSHVIKVKGEKYKTPQDEVVTWSHEHRHEQKGKYKYILELEYKKIIIVAYYTEQILELEKQLQDFKPVFILNGQTKNQEDIIRQAQEAEECYFIVQSGCGEGWDGYMFGCMVFCSMSHAFTQNFQMHERQRNIKNLRDIEILYLIGGRWDKKIYDSFLLGQNFNPHN